MPEMLRKRITLAFPIVCLLGSGLLVAAVSKETQNAYIQTYKNRAMYLKVPIQGARQIIFVRPGGPVLDSSTMGQAALFKVGDQVRITDLEFRNTYVRFKLTSIDGVKLSELHFMFPGELTNLFPEKADFDEALNYSLTQGESYRDIEAARESFVEDQFDRLISQFATTAGVTRDQLIQRITEANPEFQEARTELAERSREVQEQQKQLAEEKSRAQTLAREKSALQRQLRDGDAATDALKEERHQLLNERDQLKSELAKIQSAQADWQRNNVRNEQQVDDLIQKLGLEAGETGELGNKVASLNTVIDSLKQEGSQLSEKLTESARRGAELIKQNEDLQEEVRQLKNQKARLDSNLKVLTTGKNSVNKTLLEVQEEKDNLLAAGALGQALTWQNLPGDGNHRRATILLRRHAIAEVELEEPTTVGQPYLFVLRSLSPDLVKFSEEERAFYDQLGGKFNVETSWTTPEGIEVQLLEGEPNQEVAAREEATWQWTFAGNVEEPRPVLFKLKLKDSNGSDIQVAEREYVLQSAGFLATLSSSFSLWSLLIGMAGGLSVILFMRRPRPTRKSPPHPVEYMAKKQL